MTSPVASTSPRSEPAGATEPAEDETLQCSTELPAAQPLDTLGAMRGRPQPTELPLPAPMPLASPASGTPPAAATPAIEPLVKAWAAAWTARDVKTYLSFYSPRFKPEQGGDQQPGGLQGGLQLIGHIYLPIPTIQLEGNDYPIARCDAGGQTISAWEYDERLAVHTSGGTLIGIILNGNLERRSFIAA